jgi:hypothetical protein
MYSVTPKYTKPADKIVAEELAEKHIQNLESAESKSAIDSDTTQAKTTAGTTTFLEDTPAAITMARESLGPKELGPPKVDENSISDFFVKPQMVATLSWSSASPIATTLYRASIASMITSNQVYLRKLQGYNLIRATAVVRVMLNAQPFHAGRLILTFLPQAAVREARCPREFNLRNAFLMNSTIQPNVEIDCRDGVAELEIPYISPTSYYDLTTNEFDWGDVFLRVLSPLATSGASNVNLSVFVYFKDLELSAPSFEAHSSAVVMDTTAKSDKRTRARRGPAEVKNLETPEESGWISGMFNGVSTYAGYLSHIPNTVGAIATGVSVASGALGNLAKYFGYSKPFVVSEPQPVIQSHTRYMINSPGFQQGTNVGIFPNAKLEPLADFAGSQHDEMSINYIKRIPALVTRFSFTTSQANNASIYSQVIRPDSLFEQQTVNTRQYRSFPPFAALQNIFEYYRGSVEVILKIVKTDFHSGKLLITFTPDSSTTSPTVSQSTYSLRQIVDIRETTEVRLLMPYMRALNFLRHGEPNSKNSIGLLNVRVLNQLVATPTVSSSIDILVYYAGGPDYEVGGSFKSDATLLPMFPEGGEPVHNAASIGDPVTSIKQPLVRSERCFITSSSVGPATLHYPFTNILPILPTSGAPTATDRIIAPWNTWLRSGYAFCRGGERFLFERGDTVYRYGLQETNSVGTTNFSVSAFDIIGGPYGRSTRQIGASTLSVEPIVDIITPGYSSCPQRINQVFDGTVNNYVESYTDMPNHVLVISPNVSSSRDIYRASADDFQLGYFIGFLPLTTATVT